MKPNVSKTTKTIGSPLKVNGAKRHPRAVSQSMEPAMKLNGVMLLEFRAAMGEYGKAEAERELSETKLLIEASKPEHAYLLQLQNAHNQASAERASKGKALQLVMQRIAAKHGIDVAAMQDYVVDDESGALTYVPSVPSETNSKQ